MHMQGEWQVQFVKMLICAWQGVFRRIYELLLEDKVITPGQVRRCSCLSPWSMANL